MESDWLAVSSLERGYRVISAINTLSIHAKLLLAGVKEVVDQTELEEARKTLQNFLNRLEPIVNCIERPGGETILGADPRLMQLAQRFVKEKKTRPAQSGLHDMTLDELNHLLKAERAEDLELLVARLRALRGLVEQHLRADIVHIFGDV